MEFLPGLDHFEEVGASPPGKALTLAVGGLVVRLLALSPELAGKVSEWYEPFLSESEPLHTVVLAPGAPAYLDPSPDAMLRLEERRLGGGTMLVSHTFAALRRPNGQNLLRLSSFEHAEACEGAMENYLRWILAHLALSRGGFVLHSAGLARGGRAFLFFGPSGAGKSTVAALSPECDVLSDDLVLVLPEEGRFRAHTTPFRGSLPQRAKSRDAFPLAGVFRLVKSDRVRVEPLPPPLAVANLLTACPFVGEPERRRNVLVPSLERLTRTVPAGTLYFRKEPSFWDPVLESCEECR